MLTVEIVFDFGDISIIYSFRYLTFDFGDIAIVYLITSISYILFNVVPNFMKY